MTEGALSGIRVLDLSEGIAGPYCTRLLAGLGAEVLKVEKPGLGDEARGVGPFAGDDPHPEKSLLFLYLNGGKKGITLNLATAAGQKLLRELASTADVLVESFAPGVMKGYGLDYAGLAPTNPKLVMTSVTNFGQTGPYRDYRANELTQYALSGLMFQTGEPDREPLKAGPSMAQYVAGQYSAVATLGALWHAEMTGEGQHVDASIMETCAGIGEFPFALYYLMDFVTPRMGNANMKGHPWGVFPCRDGYVSIASGLQWPRLIEVMGIPELRDPKYADRHARIQHRDEIDALIIPWLLEHDKDEIYHLLQDNGVPAGAVQTTEDVVKSPQLAARGFFQKVEHPVAGEALYPTGPFQMRETPWRAARAPLLGEHNEEIYCGALGYSHADLVLLRQTDAI